VTDRSEQLTLGGRAVVCWGAGGVLALLAHAFDRLIPYALEAFELGLSPLEWLLCIGWTLFNAYAEGYRGFHRSFVPRVIARSVHLARHPRPMFVVLAPLYAMALFHARRRRLVAAWALVAMIVTLVLTIRLLPQPWRGIVDAGVVVGLGWGTLSLLWFLFAALYRGHVPADDSLPETSADAAGVSSPA